MSAPLLIVTGTGTGIGKTFVSCGLVAAWGRDGRAIGGVKPIETGVTARGPEDVLRLGQVSTFHVTRFPSPYLFVDPVSPHLAARREGHVIDPDTIADWVSRLRSEADGILLELAGGLFSPITDELTNADLLRALQPTTTLLVAPDRLGVLHDVIATVRAARAVDVGIDGIVLSAPERPDTSTGTNGTELDLILREPPVLATFARGGTSADLPFDEVLRHLGLER